MGCAPIAGPNEVYRDARMAFERFLEQECNVYVERSHCVEEHGPDVDLQARQIDEDNPDKIVTKFSSWEVLQACQHQFYEVYKEEMLEAEKEGFFVRTFNPGVSVGIGLFGSEFEIAEIHLVTFVCVFEEGHWYEKTGYPNARAEAEQYWPR